MTEQSQNSSVQSQNNIVGYTDKYFFGSGDQLDQHLGAHKLNGDNFLTWNRAITLALGAKNKLTFIDGKTLRPPSDSEEMQKWLRNDYMIQSWLLNSMDKVIAEGFILQQSANQFQYYSKLKRVWDEIQLLDGFPDCDCGALANCSCGILKKVLAADQKQELIQLLVGLDRGLNMQHDSSNQTSAFVSMKQQTYQGTTTISQHPYPSQIDKCEGNRIKFDKNSRKCDYCKKNGHTMDQCFKLSGVYPEWFLNTKNRSSGCTNKMDAHVADSSGDYIAATPLDLPTDNSEHQVDSALVQAVYKQMMKMVQTQPRPSHNLEFTPSVNFAGIITISHVNSKPNFNDKKAWIVDTGATDHMIWDRSLFASFNILSDPIKVGLPDGTTKLVHIIGTVNLTDNIILKNVMLIPDFTHNLLSVSKLLAQNNLQAIFTPVAYQFQDPTTKEIQAMGQQYAGLYKFCFVPSSVH
ncbi:uncharacterized protein LOC130591180 [Beta vulgaris subsp. vulgaris]|uniref:uncharacterized protein LOC130591180 n=1 Tax=Beta vulgaris subsp. vulgaris TaxID=3555 RepID=UPI00254772B3|nr:uncharacterized protein LOC130591180 [Beta vulgaris subsp. vulgaris]